MSQAGLLTRRSAEWSDHRPVPEVLAAHPHRGVLVVVVTCSPATVVVVMAGYAEDRPIGRPDIQGFLGASCPDVVHFFEEIGAA